MDGSHWIGSIALELRANEPNAFDPFRHALKYDYDGYLVRPLQQALDSVARPGIVSRHSRVEVDLGLLRHNELGDQLARRIADGIARHFHDVGQEGKRPPQAGADEAELLLSFLRTGVLPWPAPGQALEAICLALADRSHASIRTLAAGLRRLFAKLPRAADRFVRQCPSCLVLRIAAVLAGKPAIQVRGSAAESHFVVEAEAPRLAAFLVQLAHGEAAGRSEVRWLEAMLASNRIALSEAKNSDRLAAAAAFRSPGQAPAGEPAGAQDGPSLEEAEPAGAEAETAASALPLEAAGTVLLHPFLSGLFKAVGLLDEEGEFLSNEHRARGALLLSFAATGVPETPEPELVLAKLLCGMEISSPVPRSIEATRLERSEVDALLSAVVAHWAALGGSSPGALRETFLKRPGRLQREGEDWRLVVEQRGVDVLLDRLPWAIGLVMTPFMARPLRVDWR
jgi:hypothetical protein